MTGKSWSEALPPYVQLAFTDTQSIPTWVLDFIPQPHVSMSDLYATTLPSSTSGPVALLPSVAAPNIFINPLTKDDVLDYAIFFGGKPVLVAFEKLSLEQAWLSGCKSINFNGHLN